ncbi:hypothetical protein [Anoxynatronum sibiricum]|uniref:hypothetical protein n=1 Tax=Anoxynatronum sibiricum TaxID=210623 RepID=UPI0031B816DF
MKRPPVGTCPAAAGGFLPGTITLHTPSSGQAALNAGMPMGRLTVAATPIAAMTPKVLAPIDSICFSNILVTALSIFAFLNSFYFYRRPIVFFRIRKLPFVQT